MNVSRCILAALMACLFTFAASAEEKKVDYAKMIVGKWEVIKGDALPKGTIVEFAKDGKLNVTMKKDGKDVSFEHSYKVDGKMIEIAMKKDGKDSTFTITIESFSDKEFTTKNAEGKTVTLSKTK